MQFQNLLVLYIGVPILSSYCSFSTNLAVSSCLLSIVTISRLSTVYSCSFKALPCRCLFLPFQASVLPQQAVSCLFLFYSTTNQLMHRFARTILHSVKGLDAYRALGTRNGALTSTYSLVQNARPSHWESMLLSYLEEVMLCFAASWLVRLVFLYLLL